MVTATYIDGSNTGNPYLNSLLWGVAWSGTSTAPIKYYFGSGYVPASDSSIGAFVGDAWSSYAKTAFVKALANYSSVCNLTFAAASSASSADIVWWQAGNETGLNGYLGMHEPPYPETLAAYGNIYGYFNNDDSSWRAADLKQGGYGYVTVIHELGHAFGLAHPHDGGGDGDLFPGVTEGVASDMGNDDLNQGIWTTMSYNDGWKGHLPTYVYNGITYYDDAYGWQGTLMAFDIAALQQIYGANMHAATGNNTYVLPTRNASGTYWSCIWDAGGIDAISNAKSSLASVINLNDAPLTGEHAGGYVSWDSGICGGFTIAHGVTVENAIGGKAGDTLIGNDAANILDGMGGVDTYAGGAGDDTYVLDSALELGNITEYSGEGTDLLKIGYAASSSLVPDVIRLSGNLSNVENVTLAGKGLFDVVGNALDNTFVGNASANTFTGGLGNDTYAIGVNDVVIEGTDGGADTVISSVNHYTLPDNVENLTLAGKIAVGTGNGLNNVLTGNAAGNVLYGLDGADILYGLSGNDTLIGGNGNDFLYGGLGNDSLTGGAGNDVFVFNTALSKNIDRVMDFEHGADQVCLDNAIFKALVEGSLAAGAFHSGAGLVKGMEADDRIILNTSTGDVYYDADGNGAGSAIKFATLVGISDLTQINNTDFVVI